MDQGVKSPCPCVVQTQHNRCGESTQTRGIQRKVTVYTAAVDNLMDEVPRQDMSSHDKEWVRATQGIVVVLQGTWKAVERVGDSGDRCLAVSHYHTRSWKPSAFYGNPHHYFVFKHITFHPRVDNLPRFLTQSTLTFPARNGAPVTSTNLGRI